MKLKLNRPIIFFDLETTGLDVAKDHIVELCYIKIFPNGNEKSETMRINPGIPISKMSSEIHGIYDKDVAECPMFKDIAQDLYKTFEGCDLAGYNSNRFDVPLLCEEFLRCGINFDVTNRMCVDVQNIFYKLEQRTLTAAYKFYCNKKLEDAHSALGDTRATVEVLEAQLDRYPDSLQNDISFLSEFSKMNKNVDFAGRIIYNDDNIEIFNFGKHKGKPVVDVLRQEPSFYNWMMQGDFSQNTKQVLTRIYLKSKNKG